MTVAELMALLEEMPDDLQVEITGPDFFPFARAIKGVRAVQTRHPAEGVVAIFGGAPGALIRTKDESGRGEQ